METKISFFDKKNDDFFKKFYENILNIINEKDKNKDGKFEFSDYRKLINIINLPNMHKNEIEKVNFGKKIFLNLLNNGNLKGISENNLINGEILLKGGEIIRARSPLNKYYKIDSNKKFDEFYNCLKDCLNEDIEDYKVVKSPSIFENQTFYSTIFNTNHFKTEYDKVTDDIIEEYKKLSEKFSNEFNYCNNINDILIKIDEMEASHHNSSFDKIKELSKKLNEISNQEYNLMKKTYLKFIKKDNKVLNSNEIAEKLRTYINEDVREEIEFNNEKIDINYRNVILPNIKSLVEFSEFLKEIDDKQTSLAGEEFSLIGVNAKNQQGKKYRKDDFIKDIEITKEFLTNLEKGDNINLNDGFNSMLNLFNEIKKIDDRHSIVSKSKSKNKLESYLLKLKDETRDDDEKGKEYINKKLEIFYNFKNMYSKNNSSNNNRNILEDIDLIDIKNEKMNEEFKYMETKNGLYDTRYKFIPQDSMINFFSVNDKVIDDFKLKDSDYYTYFQTKYKYDKNVGNDKKFDTNVKILENKIRQIEQLSYQYGVGHSYLRTSVLGKLSGLNSTMISDMAKFEEVMEKYKEYFDKVNDDLKLLNYTETMNRFGRKGLYLAFFGLFTGELQMMATAMFNNSILSSSNFTRMFLKDTVADLDNELEDLILIDRNTNKLKYFKVDSRTVEEREEFEDIEKEQEKIDSYNIVPQSIKDIKNDIYFNDKFMRTRENIISEYDVNTYNNIKKLLNKMDYEKLEKLMMDNSKWSVDDYKKFIDISGFNTEAKLMSIIRDMQLVYKTAQSLRPNGDTSGASRELLELIKQEKQNINLDKSTWDELEDIEITQDMLLRDNGIEKLQNYTNNSDLKDRKILVGNIISKVGENSNIGKFLNDRDNNIRKEMHYLDIKMTIDEIIGGNKDVFGDNYNANVVRDVLNNLKLKSTFDIENKKIKRDDGKIVVEPTNVVKIGAYFDGKNGFHKKIYSDEENEKPNSFFNLFDIKKETFNKNKKEIENYILEHHKVEIIALALKKLNKNISDDWIKENVLNNKKLNMDIDARTTLLNLNLVDINKLSKDNLLYEERHKTYTDIQNNIGIFNRNLKGELSKTDDITINSMNEKLNEFIENKKVNNSNLTNISNDNIVIEKEIETVFDISTLEDIKQTYRNILNRTMFRYNNNSYKEVGDIIRKRIDNLEESSDITQRTRLSLSSGYAIQEYNSAFKEMCLEALKIQEEQASGDVDRQNICKKETQMMKADISANYLFVKDENDLKNVAVDIELLDEEYIKKLNVELEKTEKELEKEEENLSQSRAIENRFPDKYKR